MYSHLKVKRSTMDNTDCLKNLTEYIVKKQIDSIESIKNLSQAVDSVSSDISNLINSLLMVGNRQFAENRIQDDDSLIGEGQLVNDRQQMKHETPDPHSSQQSPELSLCSILNEALALLPQSEAEVDVEDTDDYNEIESDKSSIKDDEVADHRSDKLKSTMDRDRVANILKKYSLYDDDEDDQEE